MLYYNVNINGILIRYFILPKTIKKNNRENKSKKFKNYPLQFIGTKFSKRKIIEGSMVFIVC